MRSVAKSIKARSEWWTWCKENYKRLGFRSVAHMILTAAYNWLVESDEAPPEPTNKRGRPTKK